MAGKSRSIIENLLREGSFKWLVKNRSSFNEELEEIGASPSSGRNWLPEISPIANIVVRRCSKILGCSSNQLKEYFDEEASDPIKHPSLYARNFLEYCCFKAIEHSTQVTGYLEDKKFRRLTFDMMIAWEFPAASSQSFTNMGDDVTVAAEAFSRIAPAVPIIANVVISDKLFEVLMTSSSVGRLEFSIYEKYLIGLDRASKRLKTQSESSLLSALRSTRGERILEIDGTLTTQPVLQHVGISTWPGRLILTDYALYFEALRVVSFDNAEKYELSDDLKQIIKPELTGPWGARIFDKAVSYKSNSLSEPVLMEFPELKGHTRRDYWLAIVREILFVHRFVKKYHITGVGHSVALLKAVLGILRVQVLKEMNSTLPVCYESILMFNVCDQLPGGDLILETFAKLLNSRDYDWTNSFATSRVYSVTALATSSNLGVVSRANSIGSNEAGLVVGEITVGEISSLEKAVKDSQSSYKNVVLAQASVDGVKVDGIDTNLAVMKELLSPVTEVGRMLLFLANWEDPMKSCMFCVVTTYIICRGWLGYAFAILLIFFAVFMVLTRCCNQGRAIDELKVVAPPPMNTVEQLLAVQNAISQAEELIQDGNIFLLKLRGLLLSIFPQASEKIAVALLIMALILAFLPTRYLILLIFLELFTKYSPIRRESTERWSRRLREWWFSVPAAPVVLEKVKEDKKKK